MAKVAPVAAAIFRTWPAAVATHRFVPSNATSRKSPAAGCRKLAAKGALVPPLVVTVKFPTPCAGNAKSTPSAGCTKPQNTFGPLDPSTSVTVPPASVYWLLLPSTKPRPRIRSAPTPVNASASTTGTICNVGANAEPTTSSANAPLKWFGIGTVSWVPVASTKFAASNCRWTAPTL